MRKVLFLLILASILGCEKEVIKPANCDNLRIGISTENDALVKAEIEKLSADLNPIPTAEDTYGHSNNLQLLVGRLQTDCLNLSVTSTCYTCIYTYPPISEVHVEFVNGGEEIEAVINLVTPKDDILRYGGMRLK